MKSDNDLSEKSICNPNKEILTGWPLLDNARDRRPRGRCDVIGATAAGEPPRPSPPPTAPPPPGLLSSSMINTPEIVNFLFGIIHDQKEAACVGQHSLVIVVAV